MREIPQCWLTGQAVGVAAALAAVDGVTVADVNIGGLQTELRRQRAYLTEAIDGGPPRGPKVSITADTPAL
jgi:FAD dependent oxidoreductase